MAAPLAPVAPAMALQGVVQVIHAPVSCAIADVCPQLEASVPPGTTVGAARAYFHSALGTEFYYVEGQLQGGRYVFNLPKPRLEAGPITYYINMVPVGRTPDRSAVVVNSARDCGDRPVAAASDGPDAIFGPDGAAGGAPAGFGTTCRVVGAAAVGGPTAVPGSVGAAGGGISTGLKIAGAAVAAGAIVAVIIATDAFGGRVQPIPPSPSR